MKTPMTQNIFWFANPFLFEPPGDHKKAAFATPDLCNIVENLPIFLCLPQLSTDFQGDFWVKRGRLIDHWDRFK